MKRIEIPRWALYVVVGLWVLGMLIAGAGFASQLTDFAEPPPDIPFELQ